MSSPLEPKILMPFSKLPGASTAFPAELLEQLKEQLSQALFATLSDRVATCEEQVGAASKELDTTRSEFSMRG
jgi:hypothetical protein